MRKFLVLVLASVALLFLGNSQVDAHGAGARIRVSVPVSYRATYSQPSCIPAAASFFRVSEFRTDFSSSYYAVPTNSLFFSAQYGHPSFTVRGGRSTTLFFFP